MTGPDAPLPAADEFGDFLAGVGAALEGAAFTAHDVTSLQTPPPRPTTPSPAPRGPVSRTHPLRVRLDELLTRCFYSGAGYVFESDPHVVPEDDEVLKTLAGIREEDRRHAFVLGALVQSLGGVPSPGVFPWWNLDLNFLTVPCISRFVVETLDDEIRLYEAIIRDWFAGDAGGRAALASILEDKRRHVAGLRPVVEAATAREAADYKAKAAKVKQVRTARQAKEKAAAEAAKKAKAAAGRPAAPGAPKPAAAAAPTAALLDPKEPGISPKERGRRTVLKSRAERGIKAPVVAGVAPAAAPVAAAAPAGAELLDPNEPGISPKEKAKRAVAKQRAAAGGGAPVSAAPAGGPAAPAGGSAAPAAAAAPAVELLDPNEPGISPKEKAKRQVAKNRAAAGGAPAPAAGAAPAPAAAAAPAAPPPPPAEELLDPDEPGISSKEKGRRKVLWMRAHKQG